MSVGKTEFLPLWPRPNIIFWVKTALEPMEELLKDKVCLLRERIKSSQDGKALYRELSDLLLRAGKISAAMNVLEKAFNLPDGDSPTASLDSSDPANGSMGASASGRVSGSGLSGPSGRSPGFSNSSGSDRSGPSTAPDGKWFFDRGLEFADAYLYEDAVECFLQALENGHDTFDAHYCLAGVYKSLDRFPDAESHCRRAVLLNPRFAPAYILLGALLKQPGRLEESISACKKAVLLDPDCTAAYYDLACYYSLLSKREQSLAAMEMALCKGFCDFDWVLKDPDLESLRQNPEFKLLLQSYRTKNS